MPWRYCKGNWSRCWFCNARRNACWPWSIRWRSDREGRKKKKVVLWNVIFNGNEKTQGMMQRENYVSFCNDHFLECAYLTDTSNWNTILFNLGRCSWIQSIWRENRRGRIQRGCEWYNTGYSWWPSISLHLRWSRKGQRNAKKNNLYQSHATG